MEIGALAVWDNIKLAMRVMLGEQKLKHFGHCVNGIKYLHNFESLYLLETGSIQLNYNSKFISVAEGYHLLCADIDIFHKYIAFALLNNYGFIVKEYENKSFDNTYAATEEEYFWALMKYKLNEKNIPYYIKSSTNSKLKLEQNILADDSMSNSKNNSMSSIDNCEDNPAIENDCKNPVNHMEQPCPNSNVDVCCKIFKNMLKKFVIMNDLEINSQQVNIRTACNIEFDIYMNNDGTRWNDTKIPIFRAIIIPPSQVLPHCDDIQKCYNEQVCKVPILLLVVTQTMQIQGIVYNFATK